jgi:organic radical activating enzyme
MFSFFSRKPEAASRIHYRRLEHLTKEAADVFVVNWCLGNVCNYACTYCPDNLHNGSAPWVELDVIKSFVKRVQSHYGSERKYFFEFTGGEVTLFKDFIPLLEFLKERNCSVGIISNGARTMTYWEKVRPLLDQICLSFHPERAQTDHYLAVAKFLSESVRVHLNFMMHPELFWQSYDAAAKGKDIPNVSTALQPLIHDFGTKLYPYTATQNKIFEKQHELINGRTIEQKKFFIPRGAMQTVYSDGRRVTRDPQDFVASGENSWYGWDCHAGLEQIVVNMKGRAFRGWCLEGGSFGHVSDENISFPNLPVRCSKKFCHCNFDIMSTKERK